MALNYGVAGVIFMAVLIGWMILDWPDIRVVPLLLTCVVVIAAVVVLFWPFSKTLWAAVDVMLHRMDRGDAGALGGTGRSSHKWNRRSPKTPAVPDTLYNRDRGARNPRERTCHSFTSQRRAAR
jgi:hypothetical protein